MNWDAIGALSELAGAVAVVVSVTYLAVQIRQGSKATRSATRSDIAGRQAEANIRLAENPDLGMSVMTFIKGGELNEKDRFSASQWLAGGCRAFENQYLAYLEGDFSESVWLGYRANITWNAQQPGFPEFWNDRSHLFSAEFIAFVDELISDTDTDTDS